MNNNVVNNQDNYYNNANNYANNHGTQSELQENDTVFHSVVYRGFSANSLITFNSFIQEKKERNKSYVTDVVFVVFREAVRGNNSTQYNKATESKIKFNAIEVRSLAYGIKNSIKLKRTVEDEVILFKTNTASAEVQINSSKDTFWINCIKYDTGKKIGVGFSKYDFLSFSDTLKNMADLTESFLYKYQRNLKN